jgi:hypothetical protein
MCVMLQGLHRWRLAAGLGLSQREPRLGLEKLEHAADGQIIRRLISRPLHRHDHRVHGWVVAHDGGLDEA